MYGHLRPCSFMTGHAPGSPLLCTRAPADYTPHPHPQLATPHKATRVKPGKGPFLGYA